MVTPDTAPTAGRREWIGLVVLLLPALLAAMDLSVLFMAVPWLSADLEPGATQLLWIMDVYGFVMAGLLITMGTLGDRIGRRRLLMLGAVTFGAASLLAAYAASAEMLIVARALLGIGAATLAPSTLALIRTMFRDEAQRRAAVGVWGGAFSAGFPLGSIVGGLLVENFWWGSVFLINIPVVLLLLAVGPALLPEYRDPDPGRFDLGGASLSIAAVLAVVYGLKQLAEDGPAPVPVVAAVTGLILGYVFVRRLRSRTDPLIDVDLFRRPAFSASIGAYTLLVLASAGVGYLAFQYLQMVLGYRPFVAALWLLPIIGLMIVGIAVGTTLVRWARPGYVVGAGLGVAALGLVLVCRLATDSTIGDLVVGYGVFQFGMGMALTLAINLVMAAAPPENAGAAAALSETGGEGGGALGIAVLGTTAAAVYRREFADSVPSELPPHVTDAASGTLGGAVATAEQLPAAVSEPLLRHAVEAFTSGLSAAALLGAVLLTAAAVVVPVLQRNVTVRDTDHDLS